MNVQEQLNQACADVDVVLEKRKVLVEAVSKANSDLKENDLVLKQAISARDHLSAVLGIVSAPVPKKRKYTVNETLTQDRQAVLQELRKVPNKWIMPYGLAVLSGVDESTTASILRRVSKVDGAPIEHNGKRGRGSKYRWVV